MAENEKPNITGWFDRLSKSKIADRFEGLSIVILIVSFLAYFIAFITEGGGRGVTGMILILRGLIPFILWLGIVIPAWILWYRDRRKPATILYCVSFVVTPLLYLLLYLYFLYEWR